MLKDNVSHRLKLIWTYFSCRFIIVKLAEIRKEVQCPICLGKDFSPRVLQRFGYNIDCSYSRLKVNLDMPIHASLCLCACMSHFVST